MSTERIEIVASAVDEATATLRQIDAQVRQVGASASAASKATETTATTATARVKGLAESGPLRATNAINELAGRIQQIPALGALVVGAVSAVAAGVAALADAARDPLKEMREEAAATRREIDAIALGVQQTADGLLKIIADDRKKMIDLLRAAGDEEKADALAREQALEDADRAAQSRLDARAKAEKELALRRAQLFVEDLSLTNQRLELEERLEEQRKLFAMSGVGRDVVEQRMAAWRKGELAPIIAQLSAAEISHADAVRRVADAQRDLDAVERSLQTTREESILQLEALARLSLQGVAGGVAGAVEKPNPRQPRGPAAQKSDADIIEETTQRYRWAVSEFEDARAQADADELARAEDTIQRIRDLQRDAMQAADDRRGAAQIAKAVNDAQRLADVLSSALGPALGEIGDALGQVGEQLALAFAGQKVGAEAAVSATGALAESVAKAIGGERAWMAVRAVRELAMGFATLEHPAVSVGHFTAAAILGAEAAIGGSATSSSPASSPGPAQSPSRAPWLASRESTQQYQGGSGSTTIVNNFGGGIIDAQAVAASVRRIERSARGTGIVHRGGL